MKEQFQNEMRMLQKEIEKLQGRVLSCCGLTFAQCNTVLELGKTGPVSLNKLADLLEVDNSTMSQTISKLVKQKLVKREINETDRRYVTIELTQEGMESYRDIKTGMESFYNDVFASVPEDKKEQMLESLHILNSVLYQKKICGS